MAKRKNPRGQADDYLDKWTLLPRNSASAEALGIVCGAPRLALRRISRFNKTHLEIVGPPEMLQQLNKLWRTNYRFLSYSGVLKCIRIWSNGVIEACQELGFVFGNDEITVPVDLIRQKVPIAYQTQFNQGLTYALSLRKQFPAPALSKKLPSEITNIRLKSRSLQPTDIEPETTEKAHAFGFLAGASRIWFGLPTLTGGCEINIAGNDQLLSKLCKLWRVDYQLRRLSQNPPRVYFIIRARRLIQYLTDMGIVDLERLARITKMRESIKLEFQGDFDRGLKEAQELSPNEDLTASNPTAKTQSRSGSESLRLTEYSEALALGILAGLQVSFQKAYKPMHYYVEISGPNELLKLLQELWSIMRSTKPNRRKRGVDFSHFKVSSKVLFEYLEKLGFRGKHNAKTIRNSLPIELRFFFDQGLELVKKFKAEI